MVFHTFLSPSLVGMVGFPLPRGVVSFHYGAAVEKGGNSQPARDREETGLIHFFDLHSLLDELAIRLHFVLHP